MNAAPLPAFGGCGIELELMLADEVTLAPLPMADFLLRDADGNVTDSVARDGLAWSNELALHVIELKNRRPSPTPSQLLAPMQREVREMNGRLRAANGCLMPTAMHPWMDPRSETRLWPHERHEVYERYARIFDCKSHGWSNLQSMQVNLPFAGDEEFARLHAAVRLLLPLMPALAASSPLAEGRPAGYLDYRMHCYAHNADGVPALAGAVVPDNVASRAEYEDKFLAPMYRAIAPHDPDGLLQHEWLNARGAVARFDRSAIEVRVIDAQECVPANLALAEAVVAALEGIYRQPLATEALQDCPTATLAAMLEECVRVGSHATVRDRRYLALLGLRAASCTATGVWKHLLSHAGRDRWWRSWIAHVFERGTLAERILAAVDGEEQPAPAQDAAAAPPAAECACGDEHPPAPAEQPAPADVTR